MTNKPTITMKDFKSIDSELYREYHFNDHVLRITNPTLIYVSDNGHRVVDAEGTSFYVPSELLQS